MIDILSIMQTQQIDAPDSSLHERVRKHLGATNIYGRNEELGKIFQVYEHIKNTSSSGDESFPQRKNELIAIVGKAGVGKTTLAESLCSKVIEDGGYFIKGKFDPIQDMCIESDPYAVLVAAISDFVEVIIQRGEVDDLSRQIMESGEAGNNWIRANVLPDLQRSIENQKNTVHYPSSAQFNQSKFLDFTEHNTKHGLCSFLRAISSPKKPLVVFIDDLQWADPSNIETMTSIWVDDFSKGGIMFIATIRGDDENGINLFEHVHDEITTDVLTIHLGNLTKYAVEELVSEALGVESSSVTLFTQLIYERTSGHPLFIKEYLHELLVDGVGLVGNPICNVNSSEWEDFYVHRSVDELIQSRIHSLCGSDIEILKIASCFGSKLNPPLPHHVFPFMPDTASRLTSKRLLCFGKKTEFFHDCVQEVMYHSIDDMERQSMHYEIGKKLWRHFDIDDVDKFIFVVVGHLILGIRLIEKREEKIAVAKLCLRAGERAAQLTNFRSSLSYLLNGILLLNQDSWQDQYELCLTLYSAAAEVAHSARKFDDGHKFVDVVCRYARTFEDTLRARTTQVYAGGISGRMKHSTKTALSLLQNLGVNMRSQPSYISVFIEMKYLRYRLRNKSDKDILELPLLENERISAVIQIMSVMSFQSLTVNPILACKIAMKLVDLSLEYGLGTASCLGFVIFGSLLCSIGRDVQTGFRMGRLGLLMCKSFNAKSWFARLATLYYATLHCFKYPVRDNLVPLLNAYEIGLQTGDTETALISYNVYWLCNFELLPLDKIANGFNVVNRRMAIYGHKLGMYLVNPAMQLIQNLRGLSMGNPTLLSGDYLHEEEIAMLEKKSEYIFSLTHFHRMMLCYLFGEIDKAQKHSLMCRKLIKTPFSIMSISILMLFDALTDIACAKCTKQRRAPYAKKISLRLKAWAESSPYNFLAKYLLLEAELNSIAGNKAGAFAKYISAIGMAKEGGSMLLAGLANELAAKHLYRQGDLHDTSLQYFQDSVCIYKDWGATAKVLHLENEMRDLFTPNTAS